MKKLGNAILMIDVPLILWALYCACGELILCCTLICRD